MIILKRHPASSDAMNLPSLTAELNCLVDEEVLVSNIVQLEVASTGLLTTDEDYFKAGL